VGALRGPGFLGVRLAPYGKGDRLYAVAAGHGRNRIERAFWRLLADVCRSGDGAPPRSVLRTFSRNGSVAHRSTCCARPDCGLPRGCWRRPVQRSTACPVPRDSPARATSAGSSVSASEPQPMRTGPESRCRQVNSRE